VVYCSVDNINGWTMDQVVFFLGVFFLIDSLAMITFFIGVISIPEMVRTGNLDLYLVKPINPLFNIVTSRFEISFAPNVVYGIVLIIYSLARIGRPASFLQIIWFFIMLFVMYMLYFSLMTIAYCFSFWFVKISGITDLHHHLVEMSYKVPGVAFDGIWKKIFMFFLPYGLIATVPTQVLTQWNGIETVLYPVVISVVFFGLMLFIWKKGLQGYDSASS